MPVKSLVEFRVLLGILHKLQNYQNHLQCFFLCHFAVRQAHFAHKPDTGCSGEGLDHMVAKQMIYLMHLRSVRTPFISVSTVRRCPNCSQSMSFSQSAQYDDVVCEYVIGEYRVDVVLLKDGKPISGIEVRDTHPVDQEKWDAFSELKFPCIEVECQAIIDDWQYDLKGLRSHIPEAVYPMKIILVAVRHNLHLFSDRLHRLYCDQCDEEPEYLPF